MSEGLEQFVVYRRPRDLPGVEYAVRRWVVYAGRVESDLVVRTAATLAEARALIPAGLFCLVRLPDDDPAIMEVWT